MDMNHCTSINKKNEILVKLNSVAVKDLLWRNYLATCMVILSDIIGGEIRSRIYINEHLPPLCRKLNSLCKRIKKNGKINKFTTFNKDLPKASVTTNDGAVISYELNTYSENYFTDATVVLSGYNDDDDDESV
uniref:Uncharacterized protein n=1 Tax=Glossina austeni TaxID=7395 RepID=A0A1A9UEF2_GLOAU